MPSLHVAVSKNKATCEKWVFGYLEELKREGGKKKKRNTVTVLVLPKQKWHTKAERECFLSKCFSMEQLDFQWKPV